MQNLLQWSKLAKVLDRSVLPHFDGPQYILPDAVSAVNVSELRLC